MVYHRCVGARPEPSTAMGTLNGLRLTMEDTLVLSMPAPLRRRPISLLSELALPTTSISPNRPIRSRDGKDIVIVQQAPLGVSPAAIGTGQLHIGRVVNLPIILSKRWMILHLSNSAS